MNARISSLNLSNLEHTELAVNPWYRQTHTSSLLVSSIEWINLTIRQICDLLWLFWMYVYKCIHSTKNGENQKPLLPGLLKWFYTDQHLKGKKLGESKNDLHFPTFIIPNLELFVLLFSMLFPCTLCWLVRCALCLSYGDWCLLVTDIFCCHLFIWFKTNPQFPAFSCPVLFAFNFIWLFRPASFCSVATR